MPKIMRKVDIRGGQFTYGQRIELGRILQDAKLSEFAKMEACMRCLVPKWSFLNIRESIAWWPEVIDGLAYWINRENKELYKAPTTEEKAAGILDMQRKISYMGVITSLAKEFATDPDTILSWKYAKVFNILYTDMQRAIFHERLHKNREEKAARARKAKRR